MKKSAASTYGVVGDITLGLLKLTRDELKEVQRSAYEGAVMFSKTDDSDFCARLSDPKLNEYSILVKDFRRALQQVSGLLKQDKDALASKATVPFIANLMAEHLALNMFIQLNDI